MTNLSIFEQLDTFEREIVLSQISLLSTYAQRLQELLQSNQSDTHEATRIIQHMKQILEGPYALQLTEFFKSMQLASLEQAPEQKEAYDTACYSQELAASVRSKLKNKKRHFNVLGEDVEIKYRDEKKELQTYILASGTKIWYVLCEYLKDHPSDQISKRAQRIGHNTTKNTITSVDHLQGMNPEFKKIEQLNFTYNSSGSNPMSHYEKIYFRIHQKMLG